MCPKLSESDGFCPKCGYQINNSRSNRKITEMFQKLLVQVIRSVNQLHLIGPLSITDKKY